ncbi:CHAT domain-containing protein [Kitasatospora kifunensis]|uniref:Tetratricopeptide (TPR) repeat protein n=1 Tax=Kitasatospora kifunensis TaxID=58351 RepID=A0A7W7QY66_KITKI|nr:CHAT domain-containing protein [Kitasatospora kifunensis]MBB4921963.1 tetratricopeptide (TPR) repeat protein [Kitasatospora kifunensis]
MAEPSPGVSWLDCPSCGAREHIEAPLLVLRPGVTAPLLLAVSVAELQGARPESAALLLEEARRAGAFAGNAFGRSSVTPLPRRLLPIVLARDLDRDLADPEEACRELQPEGPAHVTNYAILLDLLTEEREAAAIPELLRAVGTSTPAALAQLVDAHRELIDDTRVRDAGQNELRQHAGTDLEPLLRMRQQLLDELCDGRTSPTAAIRHYFGALTGFGGGLRSRLFELADQVRATPDSEGIELAREALDLATELGEESLGTELAASLGRRLLNATQSGLDADPAEAVRVLGRALDRLPEDSLQWAEVAGNLAIAHFKRTDGDQLEKWAAACELLARATTIGRTEHPEIWARLQANYGLLLAERPGGGSADLTLGIEHLRAGLAEQSLGRKPLDRAYVLIKLGVLLFRRAEPGDLAQAEQHYRDCLRQLGPDDDPLLWTQLQCNLADLLLCREPADPVGAGAAAAAALDVSLAHAGTLNTSTSRWLLARVSDQLEGVHSTEGIRLRQEALAAAPALATPARHLRIAGELLDSYASLERWTEAADVAWEMLTALDALYDAQLTVMGRQRVLAGWSRVARWSAFVLARAGRPERAVEAIERGAARQLSVQTGRGAVDLAELERIDPALARRYRQAQARYLASAAVESGGFGPGEREQVEAERALQAVVEEVRAIPGLERFLRTTELADIVRAAGGMPLAYLVNAPWGSYTLVVPRAPLEQVPQVRAVAVPEVSSMTVVGFLVAEREPQPAGGLLLVQKAPGMRRRRLIAAALERLDRLEPLLRPVAQLLAQDPRHEAIVVPTGLLGLVPLSGVPVGPGPDAVLDDLGTVFVAPSAAVHATCRSRAAHPTSPPHLVAIGDPDGSLPGSRTEIAEITAEFQFPGQASCAVGPQATVGWLLDRIEEATHLHLSCHGSAGLSERGASLALADGPLSTDTLAPRQLSSCRVAVASACQSGHYDLVEIPDEFLGLPAGLLQAGAACAVTSLWPVDDLTTTVLMTRFYELLAPARRVGGVPTVAALHQSRTWLRQLSWDELMRYATAHPQLAALAEPHAARAAAKEKWGESPFAAPYHWAGFTAWGV